MELLTLNTNFKADDIIDTFKSLIWTDRYSEYGDFEISVPASTEMLNKFIPDYYLVSDDSEHAMIIENREIDSDTENGNSLIITGRSLESLLLRRIVWSQTILKGYLEGQIEKLLNENIINPSISERKIDNFVFEYSGDSYIESLKVEAQFTGDNLYDAIKSICDNVEIGFKITFNSDYQFVFKLYNGVDRSYNQDANPYVAFSPNFENIINSDYMESQSALKNVALVAGEGEGSARRTYVVGNSSESGLSRRELYVDARDISSTTDSGTLTAAQYNAQLEQRGNEKLAENKTTKSFDGQVETAQLYKYNEDFFMGDICELENGYGMESRVRVTEFIYSESDSGTESYPTFTVLDDDEDE
jgi:hypothetical protein